jgi:hypothetical protein
MLRNHRKARCKMKKEMWLVEWQFEKRIFDIINDSMPPRYKLKLQNRSLAKGASRDGKALEEFGPDM